MTRPIGIVLTWITWTAFGPACRVAPAAPHAAAPSHSPAALQEPAPSQAPAAPQEPAPLPEPAALPTVALPPGLARVLGDYETAWRNKDAKALGALFTEDGFVLSSGRPPVRGRAAIEARYANSGGPLALRALAFATDGALGYIIGGYARERGEPDIGKFTLIVRRGPDGRWSIVSDMDNGNARP